MVTNGSFLVVVTHQVFFPRSKLFQKKIEQLFDPNYQSRDSPGNASNLYRWVTPPS